MGSFIRFDTINMPTRDKHTEPHKTVAVTIIGGGYTGLTAVLTLEKRGVLVTVLEAKSIGWRATSRNGGMVLTG
jgi:glycine/D-amino acid oxidase-like deaminating enzyme